MKGIWLSASSVPHQACFLFVLDILQDILNLQKMSKVSTGLKYVAFFFYYEVRLKLTIVDLCFISRMHFHS